MLPIVLTGRFPFRTDTSTWAEQPVIEAGHTTIASLLRDIGYATAMVGKWHLGFAEDGYDKPLPGGPVDRGFQSCRHRRRRRPGCSRGRCRTRARSRRRPRREHRATAGGGNEGAVALRAAAMIDDTLLVFASDNGPVWYAEDAERFGHDSAGGFRGMKGDAWEGGHRVPFIVRWPGRVAAGSTSDQTISFTDLLATLANITGTPLPDRAGPDSVSFLPALEGKTFPRPPIVMASGSGLMTIRSGKWKFIDGLGSGGFSQPSSVRPGTGDPTGQLYDLDTDPAETRNLYAEHPEIVELLRADLHRIVRAEHAQRP
jgi:arylsulfatase A-like enzyme